MVKHGDLVVRGATHIGRQRDRNEDTFFVGKLQRTMLVRETNLSRPYASSMSAGSEGWLLVVADGLGGHGGGDLASQAAVVAVTDYLCSGTPWFDADVPLQAPTVSLPGVRKQLVESVVAGEEKVRQAATQPNASTHMGTALTLAYVLWPNLYVVHVGNSRCYLLRDGRLQQLTTDHTVAQRLTAAGIETITPSSPWHHVLWNAIGANEPKAQPEVTRLELTESDQILLCSDGLTRHVEDQALLAILNASRTVGESCNRLIAAANDAGGSDNITVIIAKFMPEADGSTA